MGKVVAGAVSLDGYIAVPNESGFEHLFAWFAGGDVELPSRNPDVKFRPTEPDYRYFRDVNEGIGVHVVGRRLFDLTDGWGGRHPFDKPIVVVTHAVPQQWVAAHPDAAYTFVSDGLPSALERARAIAGDLNVSVTAGKLASQCLELACSTRSGSTSCPSCWAPVCGSSTSSRPRRSSSMGRTCSSRGLA
jgi:dihydrofolate reductase